MNTIPRAIPRARMPQGRHRQGGFMLVIAMIIMVIMTLSSIAMVSGLRGGISAAANIAFRQSATRTADIAVDFGHRWVAGQMPSPGSTALDTSSAPTDAANALLRPRYYATMAGVDTGCLKTGTTFTPAQYRFSDTLTGTEILRFEMPGGSSLPRLLAAHRGVRNRKQLPRLTERQIVRWARAHRAHEPA